MENMYSIYFSSAFSISFHISTYFSSTIFFHISQIFSLFHFIWKKSELNSEKIWEIWKERKLNSEEIWKIQKKIVQRYGNYGRKVC
jgi:hypothetical protein